MLPESRPDYLPVTYGEVGDGFWIRMTSSGDSWSKWQKVSFDSWLRWERWAGFSGHKGKMATAGFVGFLDGGHKVQGTLFECVVTGRHEHPTTEGDHGGECRGGLPESERVSERGTPVTEGQPGLG